MKPRIIQLLFFCTLSVGNAIHLPKNCRLYVGTTNSIRLDGVKCEKAELRKIPSDFPRHINYLEIDRGTIRNLTIASFANYPNLEYLILTNTAILYVEEKTFSSLTKLVYLDLSGNGIDGLPPLPLSIETLFLNRMMKGSDLFNSTQTFDTITSLKGSLKKLSLRTNDLQGWPGFLGELTNLNELDLSNNLIDELNLNDVLNLCDLKVLVLSENELRTSEKNVCECRRILSWARVKKIAVTLTCPSMPNQANETCDTNVEAIINNSQCSKTRLKYWLLLVLMLIGVAGAVLYYRFCWKRQKTGASSESIGETITLEVLR